jgi:hypothetical protein
MLWRHGGLSSRTWRRASACGNRPRKSALARGVATGPSPRCAGFGTTDRVSSLSERPGGCHLERGEARRVLWKPLARRAIVRGVATGPAPRFAGFGTTDRDSSLSEQPGGSSGTWRSAERSLEPARETGRSPRGVATGPSPRFAGFGTTDRVSSLSERPGGCHLERGEARRVLWKPLAIRAIPARGCNRSLTPLRGIRDDRSGFVVE